MKSKCCFCNRGINVFVCYIKQYKERVERIENTLFIVVISKNTISGVMKSLVSLVSTWWDVYWGWLVSRWIIDSCCLVFPGPWASAMCSGNC